MSEEHYKQAYAIVQRDRWRLLRQNKRYREAISIAMGMIAYGGRSYKENQIYKILSESMEGDKERKSL